MTVNDIQTILKAQVLCTGEGLDSQVHTACGKLYEAGLRGGCASDE